MNWFLVALENCFSNVCDVNIKVVYCGFVDLKKSGFVNTHKLSRGVLQALEDIHNHPIVICEYTYSYHGVDYINYVVTNLTHGKRHNIHPMHWGIPSKPFSVLHTQLLNNVGIYHSTNPIVVHFDNSWKYIYKYDLNKTWVFHDKLNLRNGNYIRVDDLIRYSKKSIGGSNNQFVYIYSKYNYINNLNLPVIWDVDASTRYYYEVATKLIKFKK